MRGDQKVIQVLNEALALELTPVVEYMSQSEMCNNWGYPKLGEIFKHRAIEEMKHAERLIERIIFLDALPKVDVKLTPRLGENVKNQLEIDLEDEHLAVREYNKFVQVCRDAKDDGSRELFTELIEDEERHVDFLEAELHSISEMGIANFLQQMSGK
jgi:bacterioferritin